MNTNMPELKANLGEHISDFLKRALKEVRESNWNGFVAKHNDIEVVVYRNSSYLDVCDKYDMQVKIVRLEHKLKGE